MNQELLIEKLDEIRKLYLLEAAEGKKKGRVSNYWEGKASGIQLVIEILQILKVENQN